tara:strand:- start:46 stop:186 length:141 start_codon:yes stop_codon:yes gene_type:complete
MKYKQAEAKGYEKYGCYEVRNQLLHIAKIKNRSIKSGFLRLLFYAK